MNVIARLEYKLAYYDSAVHCFNYYTPRTPPCKTCVEYLRQWTNSKKYMKFCILMVWKEQRNHSEHCYFCVANIKGINGCNRNKYICRGYDDFVVGYLLSLGFDFRYLTPLVFFLPHLNLLSVKAAKEEKEGDEYGRYLLDLNFIFGFLHGYSVARNVFLDYLSTVVSPK